MNIYMLNRESVEASFPDYNDFMPSEWNELDELPAKVITLMELAKQQDCVFTGYNFMLCFNMGDRDTKRNNYIMFIPDPKFKMA